MIMPITGILLFLLSLCLLQESYYYYAYSYADSYADLSCKRQ